MRAHKLTRSLTLIAFSITLSVELVAESNASEVAQASGAIQVSTISQAPEIADVDQRFLTLVVRRTIQARLNGGKPYTVGYSPPALADISCQIVVTLREAGYARGIGTSGKLPIVQAAQEAALVALSSANAGWRNDLRSLDNIRIDMQAMGSLVEYASPTSWTKPGAVDEFLVPGRDGVRLFLDGEGRWFTPAEMISRGLSIDEALRTLSKEITLNPSVLHEAKLARFRTTHWWEIDGGGHIVSLHRGMAVVPQHAVTRSTLDEAAKELAAYITYRQQPNGWFATTFDPTTDKYSTAIDPLMHAGACGALATYARDTDDVGIRKHVDRGLRAQRGQATELFGVDDAQFIAAANGANDVSITASYVLALATHPGAADQAELREQLVRALLALQLEDGRLVTVFPPLSESVAPERAAGLVLLALSACHERAPSSATLDVINQAFGFYRDAYQAGGSLAMAPWLAQTYARMARLTHRNDYAELAFNICDRICTLQQGIEQTTARELWGAIAGEGLPAGASTAAFVESLVAGARLAESRGDNERLERYRKASLRGARFLLQLRFKPEECYYVRSPLDTVGGIRSTPTNPRIHLDSCQHTLLALIATRDLLFPEAP